MKTSVKARARGGGGGVRPGRGAGSEERAEPSGVALMRRMFGDNPRVALPAWAKRAAELLPGSGAPAVAERTGEDNAPVTLGSLADYLDTLDRMIHSGWSEVESCCCADVAIFIWNQGTKGEHARALLALMPIAHGLFARVDAALDARRAAERVVREKQEAAAVKGKKK